MSIVNFLKSNNYSNLFLFFFFFLSIFFKSNQITNDIYLAIQNQIAIDKISKNTSQAESEKNINLLENNKYEFFDILIFSPAKSLRENRKLEGFEGGKGRHRLRWFYKHLEAKVYKAAINLFGENLLSIYTMVQTLYLFFTFFIIFLIVSKINKNYETKTFVLTGLIFYFLFNLFASVGIQ